LLLVSSWMRAPTSIPNSTLPRRSLVILSSWRSF
jgi:hypothetical protein